MALALASVVWAPRAFAQGTVLPDAVPVADNAGASSPVSSSSAIVVNIDGRVSTPDPAPLLIKGIVYVPLRGVLENLGAKVDYVAAEKRIDIQQNGKKYLLRPGVSGATVNTDIVPLAAPIMVGARAFVPLRSLAELFGYRVAWLNAQRTVAIYTSATAKPAIVDHRAELALGGSFGEEIDFVGASDEEIGRLLDAAKASGAGIVKTRFDWGTLEPVKGGDFLWKTYDTVVREARLRGLKMVGVLGNSAQWASVALSKDPEEWRNSPPKEKEFPAWSNYVKRVVGRYRLDVQAWQVWENPSAANFRSVSRNYRKLVRLAVDAAHLSDANVVIHGAEPGGVSLNFINDMSSNGLTPMLDGIQVFPVSQWQPGVPNPSENFLLPYATLHDKLMVNDGKKRDYWMGGISSPVFEVKPATPALDAPPTTSLINNTTTPAPDVSLNDAQKALLARYSPGAQADYLVRMFALSLAGGADKVFWNPLRDDAEGEVGTDTAVAGGVGLLRADGTPRPSYNAFQQVALNLQGKPYAGNLAFNNDAIALLFDNKKSGTLVAWSPSGNASLALASSGVDTHLPGATFVATRPDSQILDATGKVIGPADGVLKLSAHPVFITNVALETATAAAANLTQDSLRLPQTGTSYAKADEIKASFAQDGAEDGLYWRPFMNFGGMAQDFRLQTDKRNWLTTQAQRDIFDLKSSKPFIYLDVANDFLYFAGGVPVTVTVEVHRPRGSAASVMNSTSSFHLEYDSPTGYKSTPQQTVEPGDGWATYTYTLPDATFANAEGYDLLINAGGSRTDLTFGSISVKRGASPDAPADVAPVAVPAGVAAAGITAPPTTPDAAPAPATAAPVTPPVAAPVLGAPLPALPAAPAAPAPLPQPPVVPGG